MISKLFENEDERKESYMNVVSLNMRYIEQNFDSDGVYRELPDKYVDFSNMYAPKDKEQKMTTLYSFITMIAVVGSFVGGYHYSLFDLIPYSLGALIQTLLGLLGVVSILFFGVSFTLEPPLYNRLKVLPHSELSLLIVLLLSLIKTLNNSKLPMSYTEKTYNVFYELLKFENHIEDSDFHNKELLEAVYDKYENTFTYLIDYLLTVDFKNVDTFSIDEFDNAFKTVTQLLNKEIEMLKNLKESDLSLTRNPILTMLEKDFESKNKAIDLYTIETLPQMVKELIKK